jgi:hypothetical protein
VAWLVQPAQVPPNKRRGGVRLGFPLTRSRPLVPDACVGVLGTLREDSSQLAPSDEPADQFLHALDELKRRSSVTEDNSTR